MIVWPNAVVPKRPDVESANVRLMVAAFILALIAIYPRAVLSEAARTDELHQQILRWKQESAAADQLQTIIIETDQLTADTNRQIAAHGAHIRFASGRRKELRVPASRIESLLRQLPAGVHARLPYPHFASEVQGAGVALTGAQDMHATGNAGAGVKIGIIDLGFGSLAQSQASGDLPTEISVTDYTATGSGGLTHGTSVAEVVHEMAPGAQLYLAKVSSELQLEQAVNDMITAGVHVINHSVAWFGAAFYDGTGTICDIADHAELSGVQWVNAAGNYRTAHYLGTFSNSASGDLRHEFSANQPYNTVTLAAGRAITLILNWDAYPTTNIDYNLYLYNGNPDAGGSLVASSETSQRGTFSSYPYEVVNYTAPAAGTYYVVVEKRTSQTQNVRITLFSSGANLGVGTTASSLPQPADCNYVVSVAATNTSDQPEGYSSEGPTTDGRWKPDVAAPDKVQTSLQTSFAGTSASSPHVAGAAALLLSRNPALTTLQLRSALTTGSHDVATAGFDFRTGHGRISLDADADTLNHDDDNCPTVSNLAQADLDADGLGDACDPDVDGDGLQNAVELSLGTDPGVIDTDGDGVGDGDEYTQYGSNPLASDTDGDGLSDGEEVFTYHSNPTHSDIGDVSPVGAPDGVVNIADMLRLFRVLEGLDTPGAWDEAMADMNNDGVLDIRDALMMRQVLGY